MASHSCDLANGSYEKEPWFEWIPATIVQKVDKSRTRSRNPRELHLPSSGPERTHLALCAKDRRFHDRTVLEGEEPAGGLEDASSTLLATWLSRRYMRTALPDAFNDRRAGIASEVRKRLDRSEHEPLTGLWVMIHTQAELPEGETYRIGLRGTTAKGATALEIDEARSLLDEIVGIVEGCDGIEILSDELRSEDRFPLSDLDVFLRLDDWDDLSRS